MMKIVVVLLSFGLGVASAEYIRSYWHARPMLGLNELRAIGDAKELCIYLSDYCAKHRDLSKMSSVNAVVKYAEGNHILLDRQDGQALLYDPWGDRWVFSSINGDGCTLISITSERHPLYGADLAVHADGSSTYWPRNLFLDIDDVQPLNKRLQESFEGESLRK